MKKLLGYFKEHPLTIVLVIGVAILAFVLLSSGSSSAGTTSVVQSGPDDADVAASAAVQTAQLQANTQVAGINAQVVAQTNQQGFQLAEDQINANTAQYQSNLGAQVSLAGVSAQQAVQLAGIQAGVQTADLTNQANLAQAGIYENIFDQQSQLQETQANDNAAVAINGQNVQGSVINTSINAQTQVALAPYETLENLAADGNVGALTGVKDSYLNLGPLTVGRASNYTPPGATASAPDTSGATAVSIASLLAGAFA